ncbi:MAG: hypothetical protein HDT39_13515 [Lachnospiraceae bacterium]|nr:hypothetical protein [Lachnospiraceae bacterium]
MQLFHKWTGLRRELAEYMTEHRIPENDFRFLGIYEWQNIYDKVLQHFVDEQYAKDCGLHWSNIENGFRKDIDKIYSFAYQNEDSYKWLEKLPEIVKCDKVYILLEDDDHWQYSKYWIAECSPAVINLVINDTYSVGDYYITDKKFNWLITQNHHEMVYIIGKGLDLKTIENICTQ